MKKLVFGLIATVMFGFVGNAQSNNFTPASKYGELHNEFLKVVRDKFIYNENTTVQELCNFIISEYNVKYPNTMPQAEVTFYMSRIDYMFGLNCKIKTLNGQLLNEILNKGALKYQSPTLQSFSKDLLKRNEEYSVVLQNLTALKSNKGLSSSDKIDIEKYESVLKASNTFWSSIYPNSSNIAGRCNPDHQRWIADVAGSALTNWFGGACASGIVDIGQSSQGGGCW